MLGDISLVTGDFVNNVVIVCTLAILIGQSLRSDIKEAVDSKKKNVRERVEKIKKGDDLIKNESIAESYDKVKNFVVFDPFLLMAIFYFFIILSVLLDIFIIRALLKTPKRRLA
jgi:hypothetical protein